MLRNILSLWQHCRVEKTNLPYNHIVKTQPLTNLLPYPIDISPLSSLSGGSKDEVGVICNSSQDTLPAAYDPTIIALYALINWNAYLSQGDEEHKEIFMTQANWLLAHKKSLSNGGCCWPIILSSNIQSRSKPSLSSVTQGTAISVLLRAYQLTGRETFMQAAQLAVHTFELDILDGGVSASIGDEGVFFEEVAIYPAAHVLNAHIIGLFGLYDYVAFTSDKKIELLIQYGFETLHIMLDEFDTGYWTRYDLLDKRLAPWFYHSLHISLLQSVARYTGCEHCSKLAARWTHYQRHPGYLLCYFIASRIRACYNYMLKPWLRHLFFHTNDESWQAPSSRVCIPIAAFPVAGGIRSVLAGVAQVMNDQWKMVYLTHYKGRETEGLEIETFGKREASPWHFPFVWLYCLAGGGKLFNLLRHNPDYDLILPQDGVHTAAFAALIGKMAGARVICMDHGNVTLLNNPSFRSETVGHLKEYPWYRRIVARQQLALYWASQRLLARIATRFVDQFLVAGDEVEAIYRESFGVHPARIIRYAYTLDADNFTPPDKETRAKMRAERHIPEDAIVVILINRLVPVKGLHFAIEGIAQALLILTTDVRMRVKVLIVGDGPLRSEVEADIQRNGLDSVCKLWGEAAAYDVATLLAISDIFLYSGTRGTNYSMAVLEAMATGCAVIASTRPLSNAHLLANGRGIAVPPEQFEQISQALVLLLNDLELCKRMGNLARNYVAIHHSAASVKRSLLRASYWSSLDEFLKIESES